MHGGRTCRKATRDRERGDSSTPVKTRHIYAAGVAPIEEHVLCGVPAEWSLAREFIWGAQFPEPLVMIDHTDLGDVAAGTPEVLHYVHDAQGSVVGLTDAGDPTALPDPILPKLVERYDYDPYGKTYIESWDAGGGGGAGAWVRPTASRYGNPFLWTGQRYDAGVGLYAFPVRTYSPHLGRWLTRDPLGYVDGVNLYEYVGSMPTVYTDPLGLLSEVGPDEGGRPPGGMTQQDPPPAPPAFPPGDPPDGPLFPDGTINGGYLVQPWVLAGLLAGLWGIDAPAEILAPIGGLYFYLIVEYPDWWQRNMPWFDELWNAAVGRWPFLRDVLDFLIIARLVYLYGPYPVGLPGWALRETDCMGFTLLIWGDWSIEGFLERIVFLGAEPCDEDAACDVGYVKIMVIEYDLVYRRRNPDTGELVEVHGKEVHVVGALTTRHGDANPLAWSKYWKFGDIEGPRPLRDWEPRYLRREGWSVEIVKQTVVRTYYCIPRSRLPVHRVRP